MNIFFKTNNKKVVRKLIKSSIDINTVALFNRNKKLLAYGSAPKVHEIEAFRQQSRKRIVICLLLLILIIALKLSTPIFTIIALMYIAANTLFGWNKYAYRCISVFSLNILVTSITYITIILYATNISDFIVVNNIGFLTTHIGIVPAIFLILALSLLCGYYISKYKIGNIKVLAAAECGQLDINKIMKNGEIDKYVIDLNGDVNRVNISASKEKQKTKHTYKTRAPKNIADVKVIK
ncbi:MAG: hypothetical protein HON55_00570 [Legionellales bacterium]|jgi:hypothetical protein|nr:hypothetical protein [Legionellales bacterium]